MENVNDIKNSKEYSDFREYQEFRKFKAEQWKSDQVIIIYAVTKRFLLDVPVEDITRFDKEFFDYLDTKHPEIPAAIAEEKVISDATEEKLVKALNDFKAEFLK